MTTVGEILAAIAKLTELRSFGGVGYLETVNENHNWYATRLAVTLHRTIDAQIKILTDAAENCWPRGSAPDDWESFESSKAILALARAINGTAA